MTGQKKYLTVDNGLIIDYKYEWLQQQTAYRKKAD